MSRRDAVAQLFKRHRGRDISALALAKVGGFLAWRTEVSRVRTELGLDVRWNGDRRHSAYRYVGRRKTA
jgi:hypothetical protein